jgi:hypothetical protein
MTAPDRMPEAFENSLHDAGHPHMEPPANPGRFSSRRSPLLRSGHIGRCSDEPNIPVRTRICPP